METRKHLAAEKKRCGSHNCAQAILCTYADIIGIDEETARNIANSFGAGMGNMEGTCGALVGAGITLGMFTKDRGKSMKGMKQMMTQFQQRNGATQCKLLNGVGTKVVLREPTPNREPSSSLEWPRCEGGSLRQCPDCVADAAEFLEEQLEKND